MGFLIGTLRGSLLLGLEIGAVLGLAAGVLTAGATALAALSRRVRIEEGKEQSGGDGYVNATSVYLFGRYHPLAGFGMSVKDASIREGNPPELLIRTETRSQYGTRIGVVRLPIPAGKMEEAQKLLDGFGRA